MDEFKRQLEEEREQEEMQRLYTGSKYGKEGGAKKSSGLEWMYSEPLQSGGKDEYLMGKKYEEDAPDLREELGKTGLEKAAMSQQVGSVSDDWARTHNDPLLQIKMQEKNAIEAIQNNPLKLARLKEALGIKDEKKDKKKKKKKKKKKEKKRSRSKSRNRSRSRSRERRKSRSRSRSRDKERRRKRSRSRSDRRRSRSRSRDRRRRSRSRSRSRDRRRRGRSRSRSRSRNKGKDRDTDRDRDRGEEKKIVPPPGYGLIFTGNRKPPSPLRASSPSREVKKEDSRKPVLQKKKKKHLSDEEKAELLRQMQQDGEEIAKARSTRVQKTAEEEELEKSEQRKANKGEQASFIRDLNKQAFVDSDSNLADRMNAVRHTRSRNTE